ncbi:MAG: dihydrodipicolinate synthase family protein [Peptococcaceae bacterium]|nr:dihydrodipicolinate synthase family protein [Peptococcaceae bacterium]
MIKGIFAPIPTPFINGEIAWDKLRENIAKWSKTNITGMVVLGSNGEVAFLDHQEKVKMVCFVREYLPKDKMVIAGTGCETTREAIKLSQECAAAGADVSLVLNPYYYKDSYTEPVLKQYFHDVAEASPVPVMLYNMPKNSGVNLSAKFVIELSRHPNIVGVKDSSGNLVQIADICAGTPDNFSVFAGSSSFLLPALSVGAVGGTLALANIMPNECVEVVTLFQQGNLAAAKALQHRLLEPNNAVTVKWGISGLKAALDYLGYFGGEPRQPLLPLTSAEATQLHQVLQRAGI